MMRIDDLPTPSLLVDQQILTSNLSAMCRRLDGHGVGLRPHVKTAKSAQVAAACHGGRNGPITVSTLREAGYFLDRGFTDITYAVGITPGKLDQVLALRSRGADLKILTDSLEAARAIAAKAGQAAATLEVLIEIDSGGARAGVLPGDPILPEIAGALGASAPGASRLAGVLTHAGHSYHAGSLDQVRAVAEAERAGVVEAAERLRAAGHDCPTVSAGSTPTAVHARSLDGVTEMRPGVYVFFDLDQWALGSCERGEIALSVLASVIGHNRHVGQLLLDAGGLALSKDLSANEFRPDVGFGEVCDPLSLAHLPGLYVRDVHQEHGVVPVGDPAMFERLPVGAKVRVLPNHACMTAAAYDAYQLVEDGQVVDCWDRVNGW